ncbi:hypothetical protein B9Z55_008883 [Caenorhabditis nigoni]|nr:hypothetical protein B9Z55_008883 [Caenorhabditis nigoni]
MDHPGRLRYSVRAHFQREVHTQDRPEVWSSVIYHQDRKLLSIMVINAVTCNMTLMCQMQCFQWTDSESDEKLTSSGDPNVSRTVPFEGGCDWNVPRLSSDSTIVKLPLSTQCKRIVLVYLELCRGLCERQHRSNAQPKNA